MEGSGINSFKSLNLSSIVIVDTRCTLASSLNSCISLTVISSGDTASASPASPMHVPSVIMAGHPDGLLIIKCACPPDDGSSNASSDCTIPSP